MGENSKKYAIRAAAAAAALFTIAACGSGGAQNTAGLAVQSPATPPADPSDMGSPGAGTGADDIKKAGEAALASVEGTVTGLDSDNGVWKVTVIGADGAESKVRVDAMTWKVVGTPSAEADDDAEKAKHKARAEAAKTSYSDAAEKVAGEYPDGKITELSLDRDNGTVVWEADVTAADGTKAKVKVNADDGSVVSPSAEPESTG
ncbi:PepSY domain-containing protein [Nonomuraea sp. NPDC059023]|uniref:PepSY domain-containing protein n=1 Tax=unclassified Nonomuraea TaxID=2593643 RepID=UPI0036A66EA9